MRKSFSSDRDVKVIRDKVRISPKNASGIYMIVLIWKCCQINSPWGNRGIIVLLVSNTQSLIKGRYLLVLWTIYHVARLWKATASTNSNVASVSISSKGVFVVGCTLGLGGIFFRPVAYSFILPFPGLPWGSQAYIVTGESSERNFMKQDNTNCMYQLKMGRIRTLYIKGSTIYLLLNIFMSQFSWVIFRGPFFIGHFSWVIFRGSFFVGQFSRLIFRGSFFVGGRIRKK